MRNKRRLAISFTLFATCSWAAQVPLGSEQPSTASTTLVDVLGADSDYTTLLSLLQRARLIPTLNRLNGSTLFAPTNDAIKHRASYDAFWNTALLDDNFLARDNVQEKLRQELFYHILNYTMPPLSNEKEPEVFKTLHYPRQPLEPPSREPPPSPPWMPIPGGTLGGEPQRLRGIRRKDKTHIGVDAFGDGGAEVVKDTVEAANGVVIGIGDILTVPPDLATVISKQASLSYFNRIMDEQLTKLLNDTAAMTLFLPVDSAWDSLDPIERLYLESGFAAADLQKILGLHAVVEEGAVWSDSFRSNPNLTTLDGTPLEIKVSPKKTTISSSKLVEPDIYASNGVLHTVDSLLLPPGALQLTPEKFLLALNCSSFVSLLHSVNLTGLVNSTESKMTILAPQDDVISLFTDGDLPERGSDELRRLLEYHFIPGQWIPTKLKDKMLLETALKEPGLSGGQQVMEVEVTEADKKLASEWRIRFGGASVLTDPVEVNNTVIYFVSRPILTPVDPLSATLPSLDLSSFLAAIFSTSLANQLKTQPRTTLLIPHNDAFKRLGGLVSDYLLRTSSRMDLERTILHHTLNGVEYTESLLNGSYITYPTLEGSDVHFERYSNGSVLLSASGGWTGMATELLPRNLLTKTGVVHELTDVMIPRSVDITIGKLVKASRGSTMFTMVTKAGMDWVLNGTAPPDGSQWDDKRWHKNGWTLLCPTDDAMKSLNLTRLYSDVPALQSIVEQHLIPRPATATTEGRGVSVFDMLNNNQPLPLVDRATYDTALSRNSVYGGVTFRQAEDGELLVGINDVKGSGSDYAARVLSYGRITGHSGGVILIDGLLLPYRPQWYYEYVAPVIVGIIGVLAIGAFFFGVRKIWIRDHTEATYEPVGGYDREDDDS